MMDSEVSIERVTEYSYADAQGIGRLMPFLSKRLSQDPIPEQLLTEIIRSPYHEQLVARLDSQIVGSATLNILMGPAVRRMGYLEDFVTDPEIRMGIGSKIWDEITRWCVEHEVDLSFTSKPERQQAHRFYVSHGAEIRDSVVFRAALRDPNTD